MYLTRFDMDVMDRKVYDYLRNPNKLHGALCAAAGNSRQGARLQFRVINDRRRHSIYVYTNVSFHGADIPYGLRLHAERDITEWVLSQAPASLLAFDLLAVPSKKVKQETSHNSKRVILRNLEERLGWIRRHCESDECRIMDIREYGEEHARIYKGNEQRSFMITGYKYAGLLQINHPAGVEHLISSGIGPEKAYGFGMLLVSPL